MNKAQIKLKIRNFKIFISFPAVAFLTLVLLLDKEKKYTLCILSACLHEIGHVFAMQTCKTPPKSINFGVFDVKINDPFSIKRSFLQSLFVVCAGFTFNLFFAAASYTLWWILNKNFFFDFAIVNLIMAVFNMLPVSTLDGGQAIFLMLSKKLSLKTTSIILDSLTVIFLIPIAIGGFIILFNSTNNYSLLAISLYILGLLVLKSGNFL